MQNGNLYNLFVLNLMMARHPCSMSTFQYKPDASKSCEADHDFKETQLSQRIQRVSDAFCCTLASLYNQSHMFYTPRLHGKEKCSSLYRTVYLSVFVSVCLYALVLRQNSASRGCFLPSIYLSAYDVTGAGSLIVIC